MCRRLVERETTAIRRSIDRFRFFAAPGQLPGTEDRVSLSAPPCGTGLSAALKPRFAGLHPSGFHPWRKDSRTDAQSVSSEVRAASPPLRVRVRTGSAATG